MQRLAERHHAPVVNRALRFLAIRLCSRPETNAFGEETTRVREALAKKRETYLAALDERLAATAEVTYLDACLDRAVLVSLRRDALVLAADRPSLEKKLFAGMSPRSAMRPVGGAAQEHYVEGIIQRLETDAEFAPLSHCAPALKKRLSDLASATSKRKALKAKEREVLGELEEETENAIRYYNRMYPQLKLLFPNDLALVESFFLDLSGTVHDVTDDDADRRDEPLEETVTEWSAPDNT